MNHILIGLLLSLGICQTSGAANRNQVSEVVHVYDQLINAAFEEVPQDRAPEILQHLLESGSHFTFLIEQTLAETALKISLGKLRKYSNETFTDTELSDLD